MNLYQHWVINSINTGTDFAAVEFKVHSVQIVITIL